MRHFRTILAFALLAAGAPGLRAQTTFNTLPSQIVGQPVLQQQGVITATALNLVEGRELNGPSAVAVDTSSSPPILYVADTQNNRVLVWKNASALTQGNFADFVIGQRPGDFYSVSQNGPGSSLSTGLFAPIAIAVDSSGNLYVADGGNNRILRYPSPVQQFQQLQQNGGLLTVDLILGQRDLTGRSANQGLSAPSANTLSYAPQTLYRAGLAFDGAGNLWATDPGNNRVLMFPAGSLKAGNNDPPAAQVLGQADFTSGALPPSPVQTGKNFLQNPSGLAFDQQGRLFVADDANRVAVYYPPFANGMLSARLMGIVPPTQQTPTPPALSAGTLAGPQGVFVVGNNPFVVDTGNARILEYPPADQWPAECLPTQASPNCAAGTQFSPSATAVIGQPDFLSNKSNRGQVEASAASFSGPVNARNSIEASGVVSAVFAAGNLFVADSGNNRVLIFPQSGGAFSSATAVVGQTDLTHNSPNLIEGREFFFSGAAASGSIPGIPAGGAAAIDMTSNPPHLYVVDTGNNRILGFSDYRKVKPGAAADLVIGQPDFSTALINYPTNDPGQLNPQGFYAPQGVAVDANGDLWVVDTGNARVLRFHSPFSQPQSLPQANLVIGQTSFSTKVTDASSQTMSAPVGIAFTSTGGLLVSDAALNRVLFFQKTAGSDFVNGQGASSVIGQPDFGVPSESTLSSPRGIAADSSDRLFVADSGHNRIVLYRNVTIAGNDPAPTSTLTSSTGTSSLKTPLSVVANQATGEIWVADSGNNRILRYPGFDTLVTNPNATAGFTTLAPLSVTLDPFGNPVVAESGANRVSFFYPAIDSSNAAGGLSGRFSGNSANYFQEFAPAMLAAIFSYPGTQFGGVTASGTADSSTPFSITLGGVQVLVAGTPAPLIYVSPSQINFQVPSSTPVQSAPQEIQVVSAPTGQILASGFFQFNAYAPGLFTLDGSGGLAGAGSSQLAVINDADGTINGSAHPAAAGTYISLYGTGAGAISGAPPDGSLATDALSTDVKPDVYINAGMVDPSAIEYSGLAPGLITGAWLINVKVPDNVPTGCNVPVAVIYQGSNTRADQSGNSRTTTICTQPAP